MLEKPIKIVLDLNKNPYLIYLNDVAYLKEGKYDMLEPTTNWTWEETNEMCHRFKGTIKTFQLSRKAFKKYDADKTSIPHQFDHFRRNELRPYRTKDTNN